MNLTSIFPGQKTYITMVLGLVVGILSLVPGLGGHGEPLAVVDGPTVIIAAIGLIMTRLGIAKKTP